MEQEQSEAVTYVDGVDLRQVCGRRCDEEPSMALTRFGVVGEADGEGG